MIEFTVFGKPAASGIRPVPIRAAGGVVIGQRLADGRNAEQAKRIRSWKSEVAQTAAEHFRGELLDGPLELELTFYSVRPAGHSGTGRNAGKLKDSAPEFPITRPDALKMARLVEDALQGVIYRDDSQIVDEHLYKRYGEPARCVIRVKELRPVVSPGAALRVVA